MFRPFLNSLENNNTGKMRWIKEQMEVGPMERLISVLKKYTNDDDDIWSDLFELCFSAYSDGDYISEEAVSNFIVCTLYILYSIVTTKYMITIYYLGTLRTLLLCRSEEAHQRCRGERGRD